MSLPPPEPAESRETPDFARRQALALGGVVALALIVWGLVSLFSGGSKARHTASAAAGPRTGPSLLDALSPDLQQPSGGSVAGNRVALPVGRAVAQLFLVGFAGTDAHAPIMASLRVRDWGGVVLDSSNYSSTTQLGALTAALARAAAAAHGTPPLIAVHQAGGDQSVLPGLPPAAQPAQGATPAAVGAQAQAAARALRSLRVNTDLAPEADLAYQGALGGGRGFSSDPATAGRLAAAAVQGYRRLAVVAVVGHFPGEGAASQDPQAGTATVGLGPSDLQARDLQPFLALSHLAPAIQVSDAQFAGVDPSLPAALSPAVYALLRGRVGYAGVAVSGDLGAAAADAGLSVASAAVAALKAGADLLYVPSASDEEPAYAAVLLAVRRGQIPPVRLATAVARDLALKRAYGLVGR